MSKTSWKLWLDDQHDSVAIRRPPEGYTPAASTEEAKRLVVRQGAPSHMSLDHDLGGEDTAIVFVRWLAERFPEGPVPTYVVHSRNPVGAANLISLLDSWADSCG